MGVVKLNKTMNKTLKILTNDKLNSLDIIFEKLKDGHSFYEIKEVKDLMDTAFCEVYKCDLKQSSNKIACPLNHCSTKINSDVLQSYIDEEAETDEQLISELRSIRNVYEDLLNG